MGLLLGHGENDPVQRVSPSPDSTAILAFPRDRVKSEPMTFLWIGALLVAALIPATIVARKQPSHPVESFLTYYLFGVLLLVAAIPVAIWVANDERQSTIARS